MSHKGPVQTDWIKNMTDVIRHRGPDDEGFLAVNTKTREITPLAGDDSAVQLASLHSFQGNADVFLGHRRLSILDITPAGHQPMSGRDGSLWITYNGEIYNYLELREELKKTGHVFTTGTDTEVLLAAYEEWGEKCLEKLNGMWAFVLYDKAKNLLFGARDRTGVKPFYYFSNEQFFAFASEIKALLELPFIERKINKKAAFDYLALGIEEPGGENLFEHVQELLPGHCFHLDLAKKQLKIDRYYTLSCNNDWETFHAQLFAGYRQHTRDLLFKALELRLRSDVPVGSCLSGGLDSSALVCMIAEQLKASPLAQLGERQRAFTAVYPGNEINEQRWAELVANKASADWHQTQPTASSLREDIETLMTAQEIPFASTSIYAQYRVMKLAKEHGVKVMLDGQGADELFTGYPVYYGAYLWEMLKNGRISAFLAALSKSGNAPCGALQMLKFMLRIVGAGIIPRPIRESLLRRGENELLSSAFWNDNRNRLNAIEEKHVGSLNEMLSKMQAMSLKSLLRYEDRNSMHFSIESRTPFADDVNLIEYVFKLPASVKIHDGWSKYLLRESMQGVVPDEICYRKDKVGFATPESLWMKELAGTWEEYLDDSLVEYFDVNGLKKALAQGGSGAGGVNRYWKYLNFAIWKKVYRL